MKIKSICQFLFSLFVFIISFQLGCSRVAKVQVTEQESLDTPYDSLGTLEVKTKVPYMLPSSLLYSSIEAVTLTHAKTPSRADRYKGMLRSKLREKARKQFGADSVIKVEYWPDPDSKGFPYGYLYAKGEMIRYKKFPTETTAPVAS